MESKTGWNTIFNVLSYIIFGGFVALGVLAILEYVDTSTYLNFKVYGCAASLGIFILMRILLNIAKNVQIVADNSYDTLVLIERYVKSENINTDCLSQKDLKKKKKLIKRMQKKKDIFSDEFVEGELIAEGATKEKGIPKPNIASITEKYTIEDWKKNLEGRITCNKCNSLVVVLNSNVGIPVLYCRKASKGECDNKHITVTSFAIQFLKWYNRNFEKKITTFDFDDIKRTVDAMTLEDGVVTFCSKDVKSYAPTNINRRKDSLDL